MENLSATERLLPDNEAQSSDSTNAFQPNLYHKPRQSLSLYLILSVLFVSLLLNTLFILCTLRSYDIDRSPILDSIRISYKTVVFDATLFGNSIYRQDASEEVHNAWQDLGLLTTHIIPEEDVKRVGFSTGMVKRRAADGGGFVAQMEVFHQLHCLDTLRQGLYYNYNYYHENRQGVWGRSDAVVRKHMGHCLDLLRLQLQCTADIGLIGLMWVNATGTPVEIAKFTGEHQCRDFDAIREWAFANDVKGYIEVREGDEVADKFP
ncbi:hypothetical protein OIDMADRAFT_184418 [Oidiodendron maius Zn]|uniref:Tat pathway signal sequence n=1 Tax=Oidiodendron maius (strain Zn) TaxID=913774 RepID=A0A0C3C633_OIDMZ|nr:hypothetical protein OIDMADRAFT_184418 [Oidiodendron maius Zn]